MRPLPPLVAVLVLLLAAPASAKTTFSVSGFSFSPASARMAPGETAEWKGLSDFHPLMVPGLGIEDELGPSFERVVSDPGVYAFYCRIHESSGMTGVLTVTANTPPRAALSVSPARPASGASVTLDASGSSDGQTPVDVAWDLDDDGAFDDATGAVVTRSFTAPAGATQTFRVRVRVTDRNADAVGPESDVAARDITVTGSPSGGGGPAGTAPAASPAPAAGGGSSPGAQAGAAAPGPGPLTGSVLATELTLRRGAARMLVAASADAAVRVTVVRRKTVLATATGKVAAPRSPLRLVLTSAGRRALKRARSVRATLTLTLTAADGRVARVRQALTLRR